MSLLNDALRNLERREATGLPPEAAIPAGLRQPVASRRRAPWFIGLAVPVLLASAYFGWTNGLPLPDLDTVTHRGQASTSPVITTAPATAPKPETSSVEPVKPSVNKPQRVLALKPVVAGTPPPELTPAARAEPILGSAPAQAQRLPIGQLVQTSPETKPQTPSPDARPELLSPGPTAAPTANAIPKNQVTLSGVRAATNPEIPDLAQAGAEPEVASVRQAPQSAAARDRQLAPQLERLLVEGSETEAGLMLDSAVADGLALPRSHATLATYYLAQGRLAEARRWLPDALVTADLGLRLLQGRLILMEDGPDKALAYLAAVRPEPAIAPGYIATLASLYQQTGQFTAAGESWIALLETDGQRAEWWLGLALALDAQDQLGGARTAYAAALELPDIAPRLRSFAQSRLDVLR